MIPNCKTASIAFGVGAMLALIGGCAPATDVYHSGPVTASVPARPLYYYPAPPSYPAHAGGVTNELLRRSAPRPPQREPVNTDDDPPVRSSRSSPVDRDCVGWWRICHFL